MDWVQLIIFYIGVVGLFLWNKLESRSDNLHMNNKLGKQGNLMNAIIEQHQLMQKEMNEFHFRLLEIEKARK